MTEYPAKTKEEYVEFNKAKRTRFHWYIGLTGIFLVISWIFSICPSIFLFGIITDIPPSYNFCLTIMLNIVLIIDLLWFFLLMKNIRNFLALGALVVIIPFYLYNQFWAGGIGAMITWILFLPPLTIGIYFLGLHNETKDVEYIASHYSFNASQEHTAVILPHDSKMMFDGSDESAAYLLKELADWEAYQVYFCPTETDILHVLQNPIIQGVWIFGHGSKYGVAVNDKLSVYSELMTELTESRAILRDVPKKKYVYQCHCNGGKGISLPYYLLETRGKLDEKIDNMPNYRDTGYGDPFGGDMTRDKLVRISFCKHEPFTWLRDINNLEKNKKFIDMYISHLKKRDISSGKNFKNNM